MGCQPQRAITHNRTESFSMKVLQNGRRSSDQPTLYKHPDKSASGYKKKTKMHHSPTLTPSSHYRIPPGYCHPKGIEKPKEQDFVLHDKIRQPTYGFVDQNWLDYIIHLTMCWPLARLKRVTEGRKHCKRQNNSSRQLGSDIIFH